MALAAQAASGVAIPLRPVPHARPACRITESLTRREHEILQLLCEGRSTKAIARTAGISASTVKWYVERLVEKLEVANRIQAVALAVYLGLAIPAPAEADRAGG